MSTGPQQQPQGTGAFNPTFVANPYTAEAKPAWMTGWFDAPWWGQSATGGALSQQDLQYQQPQPQQPAPQAAAAAPQQQGVTWGDPRTQYDLFKRQMDWESRRENTRQQEGLGGSNGAMMGMFNPQFSPMSQWERQQSRTNAMRPEVLQAWASKIQGR